MSRVNFPPPNDGLLRFQCGGCGHELEALMAYAGVEGPCPLCGIAVRAPEWNGETEKHPSEGGGRKRAGGLHLPPLNDETGLVEFPRDFWADGGEHKAEGVMDSGPLETAAFRKDLPVVPLENPMPPIAVVSKPVILPAPRQRVLRTRDEEEAAEIAGDRKKEFRLRFFDAALILLFAGTLAMGGAAVAFTQSKRVSTPSAPQELSRQVMERMERMDQQRDHAVQEAGETMRHWVTAGDAASLENWCLPGDPLPAIPVLPGVGMAPLDFEFIQARRIPGTERFLTMFEVLSDPPMVVPVEQTPAGPRLHGRAIVQQQTAALTKFLATQGQGEAVFYVLLRPGPAPMAEALVKSRPDLGKFFHIAVEPAFPADGASACLACLVPDSPAAAIFAKRAHDPGLRPAVVKLAWRQHRESGNYVELVSFEPNAWSRH